MSDLEMMKQPFSWPGMVLPIKRRVEHGVEVGLLNGNGPTVYLINMFDEQYSGKPYKDLPQKQYDSFEAIVQDGWVVD